MGFDFAGKVALVTGAGSGIGRSSALAFGRSGAKVVVADVAVEGGRKTVELIKESGGQAIFVLTDVSQGDQVEALVTKTVETFGRLDFAHNNAGIENPHASTIEYSEEMWDATITVNLKGVWLCLKYEIPRMLKQGGGAIVNTASVAGLVGIPGMAGYVASKHGLVGLTKVAALEFAAQGIRINAVCPGGVRTPLVARLLEENPAVAEGMNAGHPMGRIAEPEEIAETVLWLCSDGAGFVTGVGLAIDGGLTAQ